MTSLTWQFCLVSTKVFRTTYITKVSEIFDGSLARRKGSDRFTDPVRKLLSSSTFCGVENVEIAMSLHFEKLHSIVAKPVDYEREDSRPKSYINCIQHCESSTFNEIVALLCSFSNQFLIYSFKCNVKQGINRTNSIAHLIASRNRHGILRSLLNVRNKLRAEIVNASSVKSFKTLLDANRLPLFPKVPI